MPLVRTYGCQECGHVMDVTLTLKQANKKPPICPRCNAWDIENQMQQEFKPFAIGGSLRAKAVALAQDIAEKDYGIADIQVDGKEGEVPKVRYKAPQEPPGKWGTSREVLEGALQLGRQDRLQWGSSLDLIKQEPDLIEASKRRAMKIY